MCASIGPSQDRGLQSALRRPGDETGVGASAGGASLRSGAGSPSPKRVTFALPSPPAGTLAATAAAAHLQAGSLSPRSSSSAAAPQRPPPVRLAAASTTLADELLCFMPEVDSPHRPQSPLGLPPLSATRRWPSNEALVASDAEIAGAVDMSDLPLSPRTPPASPAGLAQAFFDLMPQQRLARAASADQAEGESPASAAAGSAGGESALPAAEAEEGGGAPLAGLKGLLCRFLSAAATSGSSIAELASINTGARMSTSFSRSASVDTLYSARSSSSELSAYGSACSDDEL